MSSFVVHTKIGDAVQECYITTAQTARWLDAGPAKRGNADVPEWAETIIVDFAGMALPVLETPEQVGILHSHASQSMWFGFFIDGGQVYMRRYDTETTGVVLGRERAGADLPGV